MLSRSYLRIRAVSPLGRDTGIPPHGKLPGVEMQLVPDWANRVYAFHARDEG